MPSKSTAYIEYDNKGRVNIFWKNILFYKKFKIFLTILLQFFEEKNVIIYFYFYEKCLLITKSIVFNQNYQENIAIFVKQIPKKHNCENNFQKNIINEKRKFNNFQNTVDV